MKILIKIYNLFNAHPRSLNETYFEHMFKATRFSVMFGVACFLCMIHAIFPFLFKDAATSIARSVVKYSEARRKYE